MSRRAEQREKRKQRQREEDLRWFIGDARGRRLLRQLMADARHDQPTFNGNSRDAYVIGQQKLVADFVREIKAVALSDFHRLELEAQAEETLERQQQEPADDDEPGE